VRGQTLSFWGSQSGLEGSIESLCLPFGRLDSICMAMKKLRLRVQQIVVSLCVLGAPLADAASQPNAVVAWGNNTDGETNVPPALANVAAIAGGGYHSLVLQSNGTVIA